MKVVLRNIQILSLFSILLACGSSDLNQVDEDTGIDSATSQNLNYLDLDPDVSDDGSRVIFISYRSDTEETFPRIYKYSGGTLERATSSTTDYELKARISPDGTMIAYISRDENGVSHLMFQNWDGTISAELTSPTGLVRYEDLSFTSDSGGLTFVATVSVDGENVSSVYYSKVALSTEFTFDQVNISSNEWEAKAVSVGSNEYVVTRSIDDSFNSIYKTYQIDDSGSPSSTLVKSSSAVDAADGSLLGAGSLGVFYRERLATSRVKERLGNSEPADEVSTRGYVAITKGLSVQGLTSDSTSFDFAAANFSTYEPSEIYSVREVETNVLGILGGDYYICINGAVYLSSLVVYNNAEDVAVPITFGANQETGVPETLVVQTCDRMVSGLGSFSQPFERRVTNAVVKGSLASGFHVVFESWDTGDGEIYLASFTLGSLSASDATVLTNENITAQTITAISSNKIPTE